MACLLCAAAVGIAVVSPGRFHRIEMAAEWDGHHQDDHKILGFVPYSSVQDDPSLRVTDDTFRLLREAGIRNLPEASRPKAAYGPSRTIRDGKTGYTFGFDLGKTKPKDALDFYARQLSKATRTSDPGEDRVGGVCPDGKTRLVFSAGKSPGLPEARLSFEPERTSDGAFARAMMRHDASPVGAIWMKRLFVPALLGLGLLGLLVVWKNPSPFRRVDVVREVDGERETWVIWFERWPVHHVERLPNLHVTDDYRAALRSSRIRLPASLERAVGSVVRFRYPAQTEYFLSQNPSLLSKGGIAFFRGQLSHTKASRSKIDARAEGVCPDGRTRLLYHVYPWSASKNEVLGLFVPEGETHSVAVPQRIACVAVGSSRPPSFVSCSSR